MVCKHRGIGNDPWWPCSIDKEHDHGSAPCGQRELAYILQRRVCVVADCFQLHCTAAGKDVTCWLTWSMLC